MLRFFLGFYRTSLSNKQFSTIHSLTKSAASISTVSFNHFPVRLCTFEALVKATQLQGWQLGLLKGGHMYFISVYLVVLCSSQFNYEFACWDLLSFRYVVVMFTIFYMYI